ncbi:MAG TPA: glycoside hydrolase family 66 protein, partial [Armatimonadota bacterium]
GKKNGGIDNIIMPRFRRTYITMLEAYSWAPSTFDGMVPDLNVWRTGQSGFRESKEDWRYLIQRAHENGMAIVEYIAATSYGPMGTEFVRKHPEWMTYTANGRLDAWFDVDKLAALQENPDANVGDAAGFSAGNFLEKNEKLLGDWWIDQVLKSKEMFDWDGFRSDGNPSIVGGYDSAGKLHEVKDADDINARFVKKVRAIVTKRYPEYFFGWNWQIYTPEGQLMNQQQTDAVIPASYMLWESFNGAPRPGSVLHNWKRMAHDLQRETGYIRERGGFPHCGWMPSNRYLEAVVTACGSQTDSWAQPNSEQGYANYRRFQFRWSEFLWDNALRYAQPGADLVTVTAPAPVWWQDFVHTRDLPGGGKRVVVHLLNMPEKDDEGWADRPPAPAENVRVAVKVPAGMTIKKALAISPDVDGDVMTATVGADNTLTLPEVKLWTVVVVDLGAK